VESASRLQMVLSQFLCCVATATTPLVLVLDDLQWADTDGLALLRLMANAPTPHLLLICSYRDDEVDHAHPLSQFVAQCQESCPQRITAVHLHLLSVEHIAQLLMDSFHVSETEALPLGQLLFSRTSGNPFFTLQLLKSYHDAGLMAFDFRDGRWRWDVERIAQTGMQDDDVVTLVCHRMTNLSEDAQTVLRYAACCGHRSSMHSLFLMTQLPVGRLARGVLELEQSGMLLCLQNAPELIMLAQTYRGGSPMHDDAGTPPQLSPSVAPELLPDAGTAGSASPTFLERLASITLQFAHDRILQAAYKLIPSGEVSQLHCSIAQRLLFGFYESTDREEYAADIVQHCNIGVALCCSRPGVASKETEATLSAAQCWRDFFAQPGMTDTVVGLELTAAKAARLTGAYDSATTLLTAALQLLQQQAGVSPQPNREGASSHASSDSATASPRPFSPLQRSYRSGAVLQVSPLCWSRSYSTCLSIYNELVECSFLLSRYAETIEAIEYVLHHVTDLLERAFFFPIHVKAWAQQQRMAEAEECGLAHLHELQVALLEEFTDDLHRWCSESIVPDDESTYARHPVLLAEPMADPLHLRVMQLFDALVPPVYVRPSPRFRSLVLTMLDWTR